MRRWIGWSAAWAVMIAGFWWAFRPGEDAPPPLPAVAKLEESERIKSLWKHEPQAVGEAKSSMPRPLPPLEPIAVVPDADIVSEPTPPIVLVGGTVERPVTRPEAGREPRGWMPYAPEDGELARRRLAEWARLAAQEEPTPRDFEETAEPPLETWRSMGRPPCCVR
jgi:hypothetical protein